MKKIFLFCIFGLLCACSDTQTSLNVNACKKLAKTAPELKQKMSIADACDKIRTFNLEHWNDKPSIVNIYENCIAKPNKKYQDQQIESMLYLSVIYLSHDDVQDIGRANLLINCAMDKMTGECEKNNGLYDNVCFMKSKLEDLNYYDDETYEKIDGEDFSWFDYIPQTIMNIADVKDFYHMSLPCVPLQMLVEIPELIDITKSVFGGGRDSTIPGICAPYDPFDMVGLIQFSDLPNYEYIDNLNPAPVMEGTMRFAIHRDLYSEAAEMMAWPKKYFKDDDIKKIYNHITYYPSEEFENEKEIKIYATDIEKKIRKYKNLSAEYDNMINKVANHYMAFLKMNKKDADKYARLAVIKMILDMVSYR